VRQREERTRRRAGAQSLNLPPPPSLTLSPLSTLQTSVTVRAAGIVLRRFTANDAVLAATHASFAGDGPATASLVILHGRGRTLSIVGPGGALARVPLPAPAARLWALGPDAGLLCGGVGGGGMTLAHPLDAPEPVAGWGPGAAVAWVGARDGLALTTAAAAAGGGEAEVALWSLKLGGGSVDGVGGGGPAPPASPLTAGAAGTPGSSAPRR